MLGRFSVLDFYNFPLLLAYDWDMHSLHLTLLRVYDQPFCLSL